MNRKACLAIEIIRWDKLWSRCVHGMLLCIVVLYQSVFFVACHEDYTPTPHIARQTVMVFMPWSTNLEAFFEENIDDLEKKGFRVCITPILEGGVWYWLAGVKIGDNSVIGAGSIVRDNIPTNSVAIGNPCKVVKIID